MTALAGPATPRGVAQRLGRAFHEPADVALCLRLGAFVVRAPQSLEAG